MNQLKNKRGQVTLFIIIAIIIVAVALVWIFLWSPVKSQREGLDKQATDVRDYVSLSLKNSLENALAIVGLQGGFISPEKPFIQYDNLTVAYWLYNNTGHWPEIEDIEKELDKFVLSSLPSCDKIKENFQLKKIECGNAEAKIIIQNNSIVTYVNYSISVTDKTTIKIKPDYQYKLEINFSEYYKIGMYILKNYNCLTCLGKKAVEENLTIRQIDMGDTLFNFIIDDKIKLAGMQEYILQFAIQK